MANIGLHLETYVGASDLAGVTRPEDALLAERLRQGEEEAYEELLRRFQQPVFNLVSRLMNDPSDSSDVVQECFSRSSGTSGDRSARRAA